MPRIPLADAPSQNIAGARMPYMDAGAMAAPARALVGLGNQLTQVAEKFQADQARMNEFKMRASLEDFKFERTLAYKADYDNSAPDGGNLPTITDENFRGAWAKVRATLPQDELLLMEADELAKDMQRRLVLKATEDAGVKQTNFVITEADKGVTNAVTAGQLKTRGDVENYVETTLFPKLEFITDPVKRDQVKAALSKRLLDELQLVNPDSLLPRNLNAEDAIKENDTLGLGEIKFVRPEQEAGVKPEVKNRARIAAHLFGKPLTINSGHRDPEYNRRVRGAKDSAHVHGDALDFSTDGMTEADKQRLVASLVAAGYTSIIGYSNSNMIHADLRGGRENAPEFAVADGVYVMWDKSQQNNGKAPAWYINGVREGAQNAGGVVYKESPRFTGGMWDYVGADAIRVAQNGASTAVKERLDLGLETGTTTLQDIMLAPINDGDRATLINQWKTANKDAINLADFTQRYTTDPTSITSADEGIAEKFYKAANNGDEAALASSDPEVSGRAASVVTEMFERTSIIPKSAVSSIGAMVASRDPGKLQAAMQLLDGLQTTNPVAFAQQFPKENQARRMLDVWQTRSKYMTPESFAEMMYKAQDPQSVKVREAFEAQANKIANETFAEPDDVFNLFDSWLTWEPTGALAGEIDPSTKKLKPDGFTTEVFMTEFRNEFTSAYTENGGDQDAAVETAVKRLSNIWGRSQFAGSDTAIMKLPPEMTYRPINGSHDYLTNGLEKDLEAEGYNVKKEAVNPRGAGTADQGVWKYRLLTMPETERDFANRRLNRGPRYGVFLWNETTGEQTVLPKLYVFDYAAANAADDKKQLEAAEAAKLQESQMPPAEVVVATP